MAGVLGPVTAFGIFGETFGDLGSTVGGVESLCVPVDLSVSSAGFTTTGVLNLWTTGGSS